MKKIMHLNAFMIHSPMNHTVGSWTHPDSTVGSSFAQPDLWQDIAKTLERGKFDAIFFADQLATYGNYRARTDEALIHAVQFPVHDPVLLVPMLAAVTDKLGFAVTPTPALLHVRNHKILAILLPFQGDRLAEHGEGLDCTFSLNIPHKLHAQRRHPHRGPA
jgi:hypothetical protein